jgi:fibronectin-binding autotransporter adhesin
MTKGSKGTKGISKKSMLAWAVAAASMGLFGAKQVAAGPLYFSDVGGPKTWDNGSTSDWATTSGGSYTNLWTGGSDAFFEGTPGTVNVSGNIASVNSITFSTDNYTLSGGTITLTGAGGNITTGSGADTINSIIAGSVGLTKLGTGTLTLGGANTYTNGTTISAGTLQVGTGGTSGSLGTGAVLDNAALVFNQTSTTISNAISGTGTVSNTGATGALTIAANIAMTGSGGFTFTSVGGAVNTGANLSVVNGAGNITSVTGSGSGFSITGTNTFSATGTGSITISGATATTGGGNSGLYLHSSNLTTSGIINLKGQNTGEWGINYDANASIHATTGTTTLTGTTTNASAGKSPFLFINNPTITLTADPGAAIVLTGGTSTGTSDSVFNDYNGATVFTISGNVSFIAGATSSTDAFWGSNGTLNSGAPTFNVGPSSTLTLNAGVTGMGTGLKIGSLGLGSVVNVLGSGSGTMSGNMALTSGSLIYSISGTGALTQSGIISGAGSVTSNGTGTLTLSGANTFSGGTTVNSGVLALGNQPSAGVGVLRGTLTINAAGNVTASTANWSLGYGTGTDVTAININGGTLTFTGTNATGGTSAANITMTGGTITGSQFDWYNGQTSTPSLITNASSTTATVGSGFNLRLAGGNLTLNVAPGTVPNGIDLLISGPIIQNAASGIIKSGLGTAVLSGTNTYTGGTTVTAGTLIGTNASALGTNSALTVGNNANFTYAPLAVGTLNLGTGVVTLASGSTLGTALGGGTTASEILSTGTAASVSGNTIAVNVYGIPGSAVSTGTYTLLAVGGSSNLAAGTFNLGKIYDAFNFTVTPGSLLASASSLTLGVTGQTTPIAEFWKGGFAGGNNVWALSDGTANSNWTTDQLGTAATSLVPGTTTIVTFSANGATNQGSMTLGANMSILGLVVNDTNAVQLKGDTNSLTIGTGGVTVNTGAGAVTLNSNIVLGGAQTWANNSSNTTTAGGIVSGSAAFIKAGTGTVLLSGPNTYTGSTTVNAGTLKAGVTSISGVSGAFGNNSAITLANTVGAALDITGFNTQIGSITGGGASGGNVVLGATTLTIGGDNTSPAAYAGTISGTGGVTKIGTGTLIFGGSAANTYTGATTLGGTGQMGLSKIGGAVAVPGDMILASSAVRNVLWMTQYNQFGPNTVLRFNGGPSSDTRVELSGTQQTVAGLDSTGLSPSATYAAIQYHEFGSPSPTTGYNALILNVAAGNAFTFGSSAGIPVLRDYNGGSIRVLMNGPGTQTLVGSGITYGGGTFLNSGTFILQDTTSFGSSIYVGPNGTLTGIRTALGGGSRSQMMNSIITGTGTININNAGSGIAGGWIYVGGGAYSLDFDGTLNINSGTFTRDNTNANTITGTATVNVAAGAAFGAGRGGNSTIGGLNGFGDVSTLWAGSSAGSITVGAGDNSGVFSGIIHGNGSNATDLTMEGGILSFVKIGAGTQTLNGAAVNTYTGSTTIRGGTLLLDFANLATPTNLLNSATAPTLGGGTLSIRGKSTGNTAQTLGNLTLNLGTNSNIILNPNGGAGATLTLGSWTRNTGATLLVDESAAGTSVLTSSPALIGNLLPYVLVKTSGGTGLATVSGGNVVQFSGVTSVLAPASSNAATDFTTTPTDPNYSSGTLALTNATHATDSLQIASGAGGTLDLGTGSLTLASTALLMSGSGNYTIQNGQVGASAAELIVHQVGTGTLTIAGTVSGSTGSLTKDGSGALVLTGNNTYTGGTNLNGGTLSVSAIADSGWSNIGNSGTLNIGGGATLLYTGASANTTARAFNIASGGAIFNISNPNGALTLSSLAYNSSSVPGGGITKTGPGTMNFANQLWIGNAINEVGNFNMNAGIFNATSTYIVVGNGSGAGTAFLNLTGGTFNNNTGGAMYLGNSYGANGTVNISGGTFNQGNNNILEGVAAVGTLNVSGNGMLTLGGQIYDCYDTNNNATSAGYLNLSGNGVITQYGNYLVVGNSSSTGTFNQTGGTYNMTGGGTIYLANGVRQGTMNISAGTFTTTGIILVGQSGPGTFNLSGGSFISWGGGASFCNNNANGAGIWNQTGGTASFLNQVTMSNSTGPSTLNISGGTFTESGSNLYLGVGNTTGQVATLNVSGNAFMQLADLNLGYQAGVTSVVNLNGGTLRLFNETGGAASTASLGTSVFNFNGGLLQAAASFTTPTAVTTVVNSGGAMIDTQSYNLTLNNALVAGTGSAGLTKYGAGSLVLNASAGSTYTGATTLNGGTLVLDFVNLAAPTNLLGSSSALNLNAGSTLNVKGKSTLTTNQTLGNLTLNNGGGSIVLNSNGGLGTTLTLGSTWTRNNNSTLFIDESASGSVTLTSSPTYSGNFMPWVAVKDTTGFGFGTVVGGNVVRYSTATNPLPASGAISSTDYSLAGGTATLASQTVTASETANSLVIAPTAGSLSLAINNNQTLSFTSGAVAFDGSSAAYSITGPGQFGASNATMILSTYGANALTISAPIGGGTGNLILGGSGKTILSSANTYSGGTQLNSGTLSVGNANALGSGTLTINGGTLDSNVASLGSNTNNAQTWNGNFAFAGTNALNLGTGNVTLGANVQINTTAANSATPLTVGGNISGAFGLSKTGAGALILAGANTYSGTTTLSQGYLQLSSTTGYAIPGNFIGNNVLSPKVYTTVNNQFAPGSVFSFMGTGGDHVRLELLGTVQTLAGIDNSASSGVGVIQNQEQAPIGSSGISTLVLNGGGNYFFNGYLRNATGVLGLTYSGSGVQTLSGGNITYTGNTTVNSGTLQLYTTNAFNSPTTVNTGATLQFYGGNSGTAGTAGTGPRLTLNGGSINDIQTGYQTWEGPIVITANSAINVTNSGGSNQFFVDGGLYGSGTLTINNNGTGTTGVQFRNNAGTNFAGAVIVNGGAISIGQSTNSAAMVLANADLTLGNSATLHLGTGLGNLTPTGATLKSLNGSGTVSGSGGTVNLTVGANDGNGSFSGTLGGGTLGLIKIGVGTAILNGAVGSTYTGGTTVNGGTLLLDMTNMPTATNLITSGSALALGGGTLAIKGGLQTSNQTLGTLTLSGTGGGLTVSNTGGNTTLTLAGVTHNVGSILNVDLSSGAGSNTLTFTNTNGFLTGAGQLIGWATVKDGLGTGFGMLSAVNPGNLVRFTGTTAALSQTNSTTITTTVDFTTNPATDTGAGFYSGGTLALVSTGPNATDSLAINAAASGVLDLGTGTMTFTSGGLLMTGANNYTIQNGQLGANDVELDINQLGTGTMTVSGPISGGVGTLAKSGSGALVVTGASTYTGATVVNAGTLQIGNGGTTGSLSGSSTITNNGSVVFNRSNNVVQGTDFGSNPISGIGGLTQAGTGTLTLANINSYTGGTTISAGTLNTGTRGLGSGTVNVGAAGTLAVTQTGGVGLAAQYYNIVPNSANFNSLGALQTHLGSSQAPALINNATTLNFATNGSNFPAPYNSGATNFESYYSGMINLASGGTYTFNTSSDDGSALWIDGTMVVNNNFSQAVTTRSGSIALAAGYHDIVVAYWQGGGGYGMTAQLSGAGNTNMVDINTTNANITPDLLIGSLSGSGTVNLQTGNLITGTDNTNSTFSGVINSTGAAGPIFPGLYKIGNGTLTLSGANTYAGGTTVNQGELEISGAGTLGSSSGALTVNGGTLDINGMSPAVSSLSGVGGTIVNNHNSNTATLTLGSASLNTTYAGVIADHNDATTGKVAVVMVGTGQLFLTGNNTYTGGTTINSGALLQLGNNTNTGSVAGNITDNGTLQLYRSDAYTLPNNITGAGNLNALNAGQLTLGGTISLAGTLYVQSNNTVVIQAGTNATFGAATFGTSYSTGHITMTGGVLGISGIIGNNRDDYYAVAQSGGVATIGTIGTDVSSSGGTGGNNTYTLTGGQLIAGNITGGSGGSFSRGITLNLGGGTLTASAGYTMFANTVNLTGINGNVTLDTGSFTLGSAYSVGNGGLGGFTKIGTGILNLTAGTNYSGLTTVNNGTVNFTGTTTVGAVTVNSGAANFNSAAATGAVTVNGGSATFTGAATTGAVNVAAGSATFNSTANTSGGAINISGGTTNFNGTTTAGAVSVSNGATYLNGAATVGAINVTGGTLNVNAATTSGAVTVTSGTMNVAGAMTYSGPTTIGNGTLHLNQLGNFNGNTPTVQLDASTLGTGAITTWANAYSAGGFTGNGTVTSGISGFNGKNVISFNGSQALTNATAGVALGSSETIFYVGALSGAANRRLAGGISNNWLMGYWSGNQDTAYGGSAFFGASTGATTATHLYELVDSANTLSLYSSGSLLGSTGTATVALQGLSLGGSVGENSAGYLGEVLVFNTALSATDRQAVEAYLKYIWFGTGTPTFQSNLLPTTTAVSITGTGTLDLNSVNQTIGSLASANTGSNVTLGSGNLTTGGDNSSTTFAGIISGANGGLTKTGTGTFTLTGANSYTGATAVTGGTLQFGDGTTGHDGTLPAMATSGITDTAAVVFNNFGNVTMNGAISGSGGTVTKLGPGKLTLNGSSTYTGATAINAGTLFLSGSLNNTSGVTVASGAVLTGFGNNTTTGIIGGSVTVSGGGAITLAQANNAQSLTFNSGLTLGNAGAYDAADYAILNFTTGAGIEAINLGSSGSPTGTLTVNSSGGYVNLAGPTLNVGTYNLIRFGAQTGPGAFSLSSSTPGVTMTLIGVDTYTLVDGSNALQLVVTGTATPGVAYFKGTVSNVWNDLTSAPNTNWSTDKAGSTDAGNTPGSVSDVIFTADTKTGVVATTLGASTTINSLNFNSTATSNTINTDGSTLTINALADSNTDGANYTGNTAGTGIVVKSGSGAATINVPVQLGNSQSWTNASANSLTVNGSVTGTAPVGTQTLTLAANSSGGITLSGVIGNGTGGGNLAVLVNGTGTGSTTFNGAAANTYTGGTTVNDATTQATHASLLLNSAGGTAIPGNITNGGWIQVSNNANQFGSTSVMNFAGNGYGVLELDNHSQTLAGLSGGSTAIGIIENGQLTNPGAGTATLTLNTVNASDNFSFSGQIRDSYTTGLNGQAGVLLALVKTGPGTQTLGGTTVNAYNGGTTVTGGTLVLDLSGRTGQPIGLPTAYTTGASGTLAFSNTNTGVDNTLLTNVTLAGSGTISKTGAGYLTLWTGCSFATFTGTMSVLQGTLAANNMGAGATSGSMTLNIASGATFDDRYNSTLVIDKLTGAGTLSHSYTDNLTVSIGNNNGSSTFSGVIQSPGAAMGLIKNGVGTLTLAGADSYTGGTTVNAGRLVLSGPQSSNGSGSMFIASGATLEFAVASGTRDENTVTYSGTGTIVKSGAGNVRWGGGVGTFNLGAGSLIDVQGGTFDAGSSANENWASNLSLLNVASGATINELAYTPAKIDALTGLGTVSLDAGAGSGPHTLTIGANNTAAGTYNSAGNATFSGTMSNGGSLVKIGTGTQTLIGSNITYSGGTTVSNGTLVFSDSTAMNTSSINIAGGAMVQYTGTSTGGTNLRANVTYTGTGTLQKTGTGLWDMSWSNGGTVNFGSGAVIDVEQGTLRLGYGSIINWANNKSNMNIASLATFDMWDNNALYVDALTGSGTFIKGTAYNNNASGTLTVGVANGSGTFSGTLANGTGTAPGTLTLVKTGTGTETLSGTSSFTGGLTIANGTIAIPTISNVNTNGTLGHVAGVTIGSAGSMGTLEYTGINGSSTMPFAVAAGGAAFKVDNAATNLNLSGQISGSTGSLTISGPGTLTLSNASNLFSGVTTLVGGKLKLSAASNNLASSSTITIGDTVAHGGSNSIFDVSGVTSYTLGNTQTLAGHGQVTGNFIAGSGSTLSPGNNSVGTLTFSNNLTLASGSNVKFEFNTNPANDQLIVGGSLTLNGGAFTLVTEGSGTPWTTIATYYKLINYTGTLGGNISNLSIANPQAGYFYTFSTTNDPGWIDVYLGLHGNSNWIGNGANSIWSTMANWNGNVIPGTNDGTTVSTDIATFNQAPMVAGNGTTTPVAVDANRNVQQIMFNSGASAYVVGSTDGDALLLSELGKIQIGSGVTVNQTVNAHHQQRQVADRQRQRPGHQRCLLRRARQPDPRSGRQRCFADV